ncbi:SpoIIE family protein phosphatase [Leptospira idonii]|uniref:Stage II sporulation protein E n=1 Tax=Leptospira idonii TaxID=1193500 RepID=A0A4R9LYY1_9LEPT|nr:SpoIIE family protein phosphatase [Leptospira idonii]TGN18675.1 stage II sporulation protein E [Leptospira idonii]
MKFLFFCFLGLFSFFLSVLRAETVPVFQIENLSSPVSLDSLPDSSTPWLASSGDLTEEEIKNINLSNFHSYSWKPVRVPGNIVKDAPEFNGKKTILLAKWVKVPREKTGSLAVRLGVINDRDRTYWNGRYLGGSGKWDDPDAQCYDKVRIYPIPDRDVKYDKENLILIQIQPYFDYTVGVEQDRTEIGSATQIYKQFYLDEFTKLLFLMVYLTVGGYFLFLFVRRRRESENFFFALFSFSLVIYNLFRNQIKYEFGVPFLPMKRLEYAVLVMQIPFMFHFIRKLFDYKYLLVSKIVDAIQLGFILIFVFSSNIEFYNFLTNNVIQPTWLFYVVIILYYLIKKIIQKDRQAMYIFCGLLVVISASILDVLSTRGVIVFPRILGYAFLAFIVSLATILANSFVKLNEEVEDLNKNLEKKVTDRTEALNQSLKQVNSLKEQQDGDYFLTSLLINPLAKNENQSETILTEFYTKQKKKFSFRGKENEIGGDICISSNLELAGNKYTVFVNGDAMGKSIQGAGGALVLGVVFHAVLARSRTSLAKTKPPEIWLKELFLELQTIFESFDGSMLTSIALGLVEEQSGFMYYLNAEHPWTILYRDGKSSFIENELWLRKLGFPKNDQNFSVKTFQLQPGDVIICGSDGRDDIALPVSAENQRVINEDETLILKWVEESDADLNTIVDKIKNFGEVTDDLTFLKVSFLGAKNKADIPTHLQGKWEEAKNFAKSSQTQKAKEILETIIEEIPEQESILALLGQVYYKLKLWNLAILSLEKAILSRPDREELILLVSIAYGKQNDISSAITWGEKLFIRNPLHKKNTLHLTNLYWKSGNLKKAQSVIGKAWEANPDDGFLNDLKNKLEA